MSDLVRAFARVRSAIFPRARKPTIRGYVERLDRYHVSGWAADVANPGLALAIDVRVDGATLVTAIADQFRADLGDAGYGNGWHAFNVTFPRPLNEHERAGLTVLAGTAERALPILPNARQEAAAPASETHGFRSRFGGLWTDRSDAATVLARKHEQGEIDGAQAVLLRHWIAQGYVILPGAVAPELCDQVVADAERAATGELAPLYREVGTPQGLQLLPAAGGRSGKLVDLYVKSQAALNVIAADPIARFLNLAFERPALAFQSLYFEHGSRQHVHQDTAFVPVSSPMQMAASWTALEDVTEGSGELVYAPGSHVLPEFLFEGRLKGMPPHSDEEPAFYAHLLGQIERHGLTLDRFLPRKGDVLIWSADLVHGGAPVEDHNRHLTRCSLVAHYCPLDCRPAYFDEARNTIRSLSPLMSSTYNARPY